MESSAHFSYWLKFNDSYIYSLSTIRFPLSALCLNTPSTLNTPPDHHTFGSLLSLIFELKWNFIKEPSSSDQISIIFLTLAPTSPLPSLPDPSLAYYHISFLAFFIIWGHLLVHRFPCLICVSIFIPTPSVHSQINWKVSAFVILVYPHRNIHVDV